MIRLLQHYTSNFNPLIDITRPIHEAYCNKHGYQLHIREVPEYPVYNGLEKLNQILEVCNNGDTALVVDADACITNLTIKIENFRRYGKDLYFSEGMNCGVFIVIKQNWTCDIINTVKEGIIRNAFNCEQDGFEIIRRVIDTNVEMCNHPCFNSYLSELYSEIPQPVTKEQGQWEKGCFVLHVPALPLEKRIEILNNVKKDIVYE